MRRKFKISKPVIIAGIVALLLIGIVIISVTGDKKIKGTKIVFTTGFADDEVFKIGKSSCTLPEAMVYLTTAKNQYESVYGVEMWNHDFGGVTLEEYLKNMIVSQLSQIKSMNLLAENMKITLTDAEKKLAEKAAAEYFSTLNDTEKSYMNVNEDIIVKLYSEYALANKVYKEITKDVNPEISDDEARSITVKQILIKTYTVNDKGEKVTFDDAQKAQAYQKASEALARAQAGEDFDSLIEIYNEDSKSTYEFGKGVMPAAFEEAAFNLDMDEISGIVETEYGYHIIKCISNFDKEKTDANKVTILEQRKSEAFDKVYDAYIKDVSSDFNDALWDKVTLKIDEKITTTNFFDIYNKYFSSDN